MIRAWKIVLAVVAVLFVLGVILAGTGLLTGASPVRIAGLVLGDMDTAAGAFAAAVAEAAQTL